MGCEGNYVNIFCWSISMHVTIKHTLIFPTSLDVKYPDITGYLSVLISLPKIEVQDLLVLGEGISIWGYEFASLHEYVFLDGACKTKQIHTSTQWVSTICTVVHNTMYLQFDISVGRNTNL